jgi:hypothetical protein
LIDEWFSMITTTSTESFWNFVCSV